MQAPIMKFKTKQKRFNGFKHASVLLKRVIYQKKEFKILAKVVFKKMYS